MNKQYRKEKFESRNEALIWVADNKPVYKTNGLLNTESKFWEVNIVNDYWQDWHKAIETVPEKRTIEVWVNVYPDSIGVVNKTKEYAIKNKGSKCIGTIKLSREITIVDGKVVEDDNAI